MQNSPYSFLKTKKMIEILDGDTKYESYKCKNGVAIEIAMPNLSGKDICDISTAFGFPQSPTGKSRWQYFEQLLDDCIKTGKAVELLNYLFSPGQFAEKLKGYSQDVKNEAYQAIVNYIINVISEKLRTSGTELVFVNKNIVARPIGNNVVVQSSKIKEISRDYIKSISSRAMEDVEQHNFDSAITKSRTLLEEIFCYVIEQKNQTPSEGGNIGNLFKQVKDLYNMHTDPNTDKRVKNLITGLNSLVSAIAEMRNKDSDSHGVGAKRINIDEHHARLFVNAAMTMADFILSVENKINKHN